jgi:hypothetical protein
MFVPIILGSDKTTVSVATGNNEYWPIYLSIGNIHNNTRRAHRNGVVLLGFHAIPKGNIFYALILLCPVNSALLQPTKNMLDAQSFVNFAASYFTRRFPRSFLPSYQP